jgi:peptide deformylase
MPVRDILQEKFILNQGVLDPQSNAPESVLRGVALPVPEELFGTPELVSIIRDMTDTLEKEADGVALAAPQIGIPYRIFVVRHDRTIPPDHTEAEEKNTSTYMSTSSVASDSSSATAKEPQKKREADIGVFINPRFIKSSRRRVEMDEGCLSVRGIYGTTLRHERATVQARTVDGKKFERGAGGLLAQIFQHETDHLDGILFIDHAVELVRVKNKSTHAEEIANAKEDEEMAPA